MKSKILLTLMTAVLTLASLDKGICSEVRVDAAVAREALHTLSVSYIAGVERVLHSLQEQDIHGATHTLFGVGSRYQYPFSISRKKMHTYIRTNPRKKIYHFNFKEVFPSKAYSPVSYFARGLDNTGALTGTPGVNNDLIFHAWPNGNKWADPEDIRLIPAQMKDGRKRNGMWQSSDGVLHGEHFDGTRYNLTGSYVLEGGERVGGYPKNPRGDTGIVGRGELGLWGANFAADPVLVRVTDSGKLEVLLVQRLDGLQWSLPGGMFDPEDKSVSFAAVRELAEETGINRSRETPLNLHELVQWFKTITISFGEVYTGYCDDPRNTDNAWMETSAFLWLVKKDIAFHINKKGDETVKVGWFEITPELLSDRPVHGKKLFASHSFILRKAMRELLKNK